MNEISRMAMARHTVIMNTGQPACSSIYYQCVYLVLQIVAGKE